MNLPLSQARPDFREIVESAGNLIARFDAQRRFLYVNPYIESLGGRNAGDYLGKTLDEAGPPLSESAAIWESHIAKVLASVATEFEFQLNSPAGRRLFVAQLFPFKGSAGESPSVLAIAHDITAVRQAALEGEARLTAVVETAVDGILTINERGAIDWLNSAALRLFGYRLDELVGKRAPAHARTLPSEEHDRYLHNS